MYAVLAVLQGAVAVAFLLLGLATAVSWLLRRDRSLGFLALAIVLLSAFVLSGRLAGLLGIASPLIVLAGVLVAGVLALLGSGYALLRFRDSFIPLPPRWHAVAVVAAVAAGGLFAATTVASTVWATSSALRLASALAVLLVWSASVGEPCIRFWLASRGLPAVQKRRMQSLSLGFAGLVLILLFSVAAGDLARSPVGQAAIQVAALIVVPLLYISFSPPAWLRRQWRASEEEGLRQVMQDLLVVKDDRVVLIDQALDWAIRLVGASAAVVIDPTGGLVISHGVDLAEQLELRDRLVKLRDGPGRVTLHGSRRATLSLSLPIHTGLPSRLVLIAGPFTPIFGAEESSRVQQYALAMTAAFDRLSLIDELEATNARLQKANQHKSDFLANMSHELRTPLNSILGFSDLLIDATDGQFDDAARRRFLEQISSSGRHLLGLINDILDLSKIEAGQMVLRLETVALAEVVKQVLSTIEPLAAKKKIRIEADGASGGELLADAGKLKQMLLNLVSNAIKFTPEGGLVTIGAQRLPDAVEIFVSDTGIGIAESDRGRLFVEFQQLDTGVSRQQQGTGLGLALTKRFAELHGGEIRVVSQLGKGSVFTLKLPLRLPRAEQPAATPELLTAADVHDTRPLVLVVDDNLQAASLLARHLGRGGFRTEVAVTGIEAVRKARQLQPVAITLDILLPGIDGWEVLTELKNDAATRDIPVVVVSVVDNPELGRALGAVDYFVKPVDGKALLQRLGRYTFTSKVQSEDIRILVIDDEPANLEWLEGVLKSAGFTVISAHGGREGIKLAKSKKPHLVLLDLMMPEVSGFDVVAALRAEDSTRSIPIMILTGKDLTDDDKGQLNGHVAAIRSRGSMGSIELLDWLQRLVSGRSAA